MAPAHIIDYVIVHELAHTVRKDHSRAYWKLVARLMPHYEACRIWLKRYGHQLIL
jgi:hypothetical protein